MSPTHTQTHTDTSCWKPQKPTPPFHFQMAHLLRLHRAEEFFHARVPDVIFFQTNVRDGGAVALEENGELVRSRIVDIAVRQVEDGRIARHVFHWKRDKRKHEEFGKRHRALSLSLSPSSHIIHQAHTTHTQHTHNTQHNTTHTHT